MAALIEMHKITRLILHREVLCAAAELLPRIEEACFVCDGCVSQCSYLQRVPFLRVEEALMEHRSHSFSLIEKQAWVKQILEQCACVMTCVTPKLASRLCRSLEGSSDKFSLEGTLTIVASHFICHSIIQMECVTQVWSNDLRVRKH